VVAPIVLDLPPPLSVNKTRRYDWSSHKRAQAWTRAADALVLVAKCRVENPFRPLLIKRFQLKVTLSEAHTKIDLDNSIKLVCDYLRRIDVIEDDSWKHMRRLVVEWGDAPEGCRVEVQPL